MHLRFLSACKRTEPLRPSRHSTPADIHLRGPPMRDRLQLTRQPLIATPFLAGPRGTPFVRWRASVMSNWYLSSSMWIEAPEKKKKKGQGGGEPKRWQAHPPRKNFAAAVSTLMKLNTCNAASRGVCSAFGCGWRAGPSPTVRWRHYSLQAPAQSEIGVKLNHMHMF